MGSGYVRHKVQIRTSVEVVNKEVSFAVIDVYTDNE